MKKLKLFSLIIFIAIIFCGCDRLNGSGFMMGQRLYKLNHNQYANKPEERINIIVEAINNEDKDAIYNMFSQTAKDYGISDESIIELIKFMQKDIYSLKITSNGNESIENHHGIKKISYQKICEIYINKNLYRISVGECVRDDTNEKNVGLEWIIVYPDGKMIPKDVGEYGVYIIE